MKTYIFLYFPMFFSVLTPEKRVTTSQKPTAKLLLAQHPSRTPESEVQRNTQENHRVWPLEGNRSDSRKFLQKNPIPKSGS